ncbi:hypothetical protein D3C78_1494960 [compost metagenome]
MASRQRADLDLVGSHCVGVLGHRAIKRQFDGMTKGGIYSLVQIDRIIDVRKIELGRFGQVSENLLRDSDVGRATAIVGASLDTGTSLVVALPRSVLIHITGRVLGYGRVRALANDDADHTSVRSAGKHDGSNRCAQQCPFQHLVNSC